MDHSTIMIMNKKKRKEVRAKLRKALFFVFFIVCTSYCPSATFTASNFRVLPKYPHLLNRKAISSRYETNSIAVKLRSKSLALSSVTMSINVTVTDSIPRLKRIKRDNSHFPNELLENASSMAFLS